MNNTFKSGLVALAFVGLAACGVSEAETLPTPTTVPPVSTTAQVEVPTTIEPTTTTSTIVVTVPQTSVAQPTTTLRPVETYVPEVTPEIEYEEPVYEAPVENYEPMGTNAFLECVKMRESGGDYSINTGNGYYGAYQFSQSTWDNTANYAGRYDLVGVRASDTSPATQDFMAITLYNWYGASPWAGPGC